jgi:DegV family protein with EDD domain
MVVPMLLEVVEEWTNDASSLARSKTAAPSPGAFLDAIEAADEGDGVVVVTVAARLSASYGSALTACGLSKCMVRVVDSASATSGEGLVALAAIEAARKDEPINAVAQAAREAAREVRLVAQIEHLDELARGGRLPNGVAFASRRAGMRVLFELRQGKIRPLRPAFGLESAEQRLLRFVASTLRPGGELHLGGFHAGAGDSARRLVEAVSARQVPKSCFVAELSPMMRAHTGQGVSGLAWRVVEETGRHTSGGARRSKRR